MAYSPISRFSALILLGGALLSGCCANDYCGRDDSKEDIITLVFNRSATSAGFIQADLDTLIVLRYPLLINANTKPESVTIIRTAAQDYDTLFLNNTKPFAQVGAVRLNQYKYIVRYYRTPRNVNTPRERRPATALIIDQANLKGSFEGDGCCTYYTNTQKLITARRDSTSPDTTYNLRSSPVLKIYRHP